MHGAVHRALMLQLIRFPTPVIKRLNRYSNKDRELDMLCDQTLIMSLCPRHTVTALLRWPVTAHGTYLPSQPMLHHPPCRWPDARGRCVPTVLPSFRSQSTAGRIITPPSREPCRCYWGQGAAPGTRPSRCCVAAVPADETLPALP